MLPIFQEVVSEYEYRSGTLFHLLMNSFSVDDCSEKPAMEIKLSGVLGLFYMQFVFC